MQIITRDKLTVVFDRRDEPVARIRPGERILVECEDARGGRNRTPETTTPAYLTKMRRQGWYGNPVTGPIYIEGAKPGDTLAVTILEQTIDNLGWIPIWPFLFHFEDLFAEPDTLLVGIHDGFVHLPSGARVPVRPMIGTIGTAPAMEAVLSGGMGRHGGNVDAEEIRAGSTIFLPVAVEGALLALGDCHAVQSDGELASVEIRSDVSISCEVISGRSPVMSWPRIETPDELIVVAVGRPLEEALSYAFKDLILWVCERTGLARQDAYAVIGTGGQARPGQAQVGLYSMRCSVPKRLIE
jgi:amidase